MSTPSENLLSIDPGVQGTGYALWNPYGDLLQYGIFSCKIGDWEAKAGAIAAMVKQLVQNKKVHKVWIEQPAFHQSAGGQMVARSGALVKLTLCTGMIAMACRPAEVEYVSIMQWKGQLPKEIVWKRIRKIMPRLRAESHALDAIGIGLHKQGRF